jgi:hypothetical protein
MIHGMFTNIPVMHLVKQQCATDMQNHAINDDTQQVYYGYCGCIQY